MKKQTNNKFLVCFNSSNHNPSHLFQAEKGILIPAVSFSKTIEFFLLRENEVKLNHFLIRNERDYLILSDFLDMLKAQIQYFSFVGSIFSFKQTEL